MLKYQYKFKGGEKVDYFGIPEIIRDYLVYIETVKGKSSSTADIYYRDLRSFFRYMFYLKFRIISKDEVDTADISGLTLDQVKSITLTDAYEYMVYCKKERGNNNKTQARKTTSIKQFYRYLANRAHKIEKSPIEELDPPKLNKTLPKYLTLEQSRRVLDNIEGPYKERNYAIVTLFLNCGLRLAELCSLNLRDINFTDKIVVVTGKGNKQRQVYLNDACIDSIKEYMKVRKPSKPDEPALFVSKRGSRIGRRMVEQIVTDLLNRSDLGGMGLSTHKLRHTAATLMHQYGNVDIRVLQEILGHENLGTTEIYTHLSNEQIQKALNSNPLSNMKQKQ